MQERRKTRSGRRSEPGREAGASDGPDRRVQCALHSPGHGHGRLLLLRADQPGLVAESVGQRELQVGIGTRRELVAAGIALCAISRFVRPSVASGLSPPLVTVSAFVGVGKGGGQGDQNPPRF